MSGQAAGGTRKRFLTAAVFRPWRGSKGFAAPGLPGRAEGYPNKNQVSTWRGLE